MNRAKFVSLLLLFSMFGGAEASTALVRMWQDTYRGINSPPLYSSANFAFGVFPSSTFTDRNVWQIGPLTAADVGQPISLTAATAANYPGLDFPRLLTQLGSGSQYLLWTGMNRPIAPVDSFGGLEKWQIIRGFHEPRLVAETFVPFSDPNDFTGYRFDRVDFTLNALGSHQDGQFYYIDAVYEVNMFGELVPEPGTVCLILVGSAFAFGRRPARRNGLNR
jgi:hypothetical protein